MKALSEKKIISPPVTSFGRSNKNMLKTLFGLNVTEIYDKLDIKCSQTRVNNSSLKMIKGFCGMKSYIY